MQSSEDSEDDSFHCQICFDDVIGKPGSIYQCPAGHIYCSNCFPGALSHCSTCQQLMGDIRVRGMEKHRDRVVRERGREREREEKRQEEMEREEGRQRVEKRKMKEARKRSAAEDTKKKALVAAALAEAENVCHNHSGLPGHPAVLGIRVLADSRTTKCYWAGAFVLVLLALVLVALPKGYTHTASMDSHNAHASLDSVIRQQASLDLKYEQLINVETISASEKEEEGAYDREKKNSRICTGKSCSDKRRNQAEC